MCLCSLHNHTGKKTNRHPNFKYGIKTELDYKHFLRESERDRKRKREKKSQRKSTCDTYIDWEFKSVHLNAIVCFFLLFIFSFFFADRNHISSQQHRFPYTYIHDSHGNFTHLTTRCSIKYIHDRFLTFDEEIRCIGFTISSDLFSYQQQQQAVAIATNAITYECGGFTILCCVNSNVIFMNDHKSDY